jgi:hypothetical protein
MTTQTRAETPGASFVSLAVAAGAFGISVKTLRRRISDGTVHGYHVGRLIRVDLEELRQRMLVEIPTRKRLDG